MKAQSSTLKALKGTRKKSRETKVFLNSELTKIPTAPKFLEKPARKYYRTICQHLLDNKSLFSVDSYLVALAANSLNRIEEIQRKFTNGEYSLTQTFNSGAKNVSVEYTLLKDAQKDFKEYSKQLGLDVSSRDKIRAFIEGNKDANTKQGLLPSIKNGTGN